MPSQCEPFCLCRFLGNTSSLCAEKTNAAIRTPHASELFRLPTLVPRTGQTISCRPKDAWLCARMAATTPDEITRWLAVLELAASQLSYRSALKLLSTCSGLARTRVRQNVLEKWCIRSMQAAEIVSTTERGHQRVCLWELLHLWLQIAQVLATQRRNA